MPWTASALEQMDKHHCAPVIYEVKSQATGTLMGMDARQIGLAILGLGAGRAKASDAVDPAVGVDQMLKVGQAVGSGDALLRIHARSQVAADCAEQIIRQGVLVV